MSATFRFDDDDGSDNEDGEEGFGWGGRNATIFLIDAAPEMHKSLAEGNEDSAFKKAIKCAHSTLGRKIISSPQDLTGCVIFNTEKVKNSSDFNSVYVLQDLDKPGADRILELEKLSERSFEWIKTSFGSSTNASLDEVLWICQTMFTRCKSKLDGQSILLFTCRDDPHSGDQHKKKQAVKKAQDLDEAEITLEVLHMGDSFDINKFYKELVILDDENSEENLQGTILADPTSRFEDLLDRVKRLEHKRRSTGRVGFTLAPGVEFAVGFYTTVRTATKPSKLNLYKITNEEIKYTKKEFLEETGELLLPSDFSFSQNYGGREIKFTGDERKGINQVYETGIQLLGFKPKSFLEPHLYLKPANFLYPDELGIKGSVKLFAALLERCLSREVVPIVRVVARRNASTAWAALLPQAEEFDEKNYQITPPGFYVIYLPFADDFRNLEINKSTVATASQTDAAKEVVKKLAFKYHVECFENPSLQTHWRNIEALALNRMELEPVVDYTVPNYDRIKKKAGTLLSNLQELVYEHDYDPNVKIKKPANTYPAPKKVKPDPSSINVEEMAKSHKIEKLTVDVLKQWLKERNVQVTGKKKPQLVQDVYDELGL